MDPSGLRAMLGFWVFAQAGIDAPAIDPVVLYFNDRFLGLYFNIEKVDEQFFERRGVDRGTTLKAILGNADFSAKTLSAPNMAFEFPLEKSSFTPVIRLCEIIQKAGDAKEKAAELGAIVDVNQLLDYLAAAVVMKHFDGFANNYYLYHDLNRKPIPHCTLGFRSHYGGGLDRLRFRGLDLRVESTNQDALKRPSESALLS